MKKEKTVKLNKLFSKPIKEAHFQKRFLGALEIKKDKEFLDASFESHGGMRTARADLDATALQRINKLAPYIKANRGAVKGAPLVAAGILAAGLTVFSLFFMNPLLEKGIETGLEGIFGARAELDGLKFQPLRFRLAIEALRVADAEKPMTNLFESGKLEFRLNPAALFRGKVYIEEASAASIALGTPRQSSGALPGKETPPVKAAKEKPESPPLIDFARFDAKALLEQEKSKLAVSAAYAQSAKAYDEAAARWEGRVEASTAALQNAQQSSKAVLSLDLNSIRTLDQASKAIGDTKAAISAASAVGNEAAAISSGIATDAEALSELSKATRAAFNKDADYLKALVNPKSGAAMAALEPSLRAMLSDKAELYLDYGIKILDAALKLKASGGAQDATKDKKSLAARGRTVPFPSVGYAAFRLGLLRSDFTVEGSSWAVELKELSSEPELSAGPSALLVSMSRANGFAVKNALEADLRSSSKASYTGKADIERLPIDLGSALADVGLDGFSGSASGSLSLSGEKDGASAGRLALTVREPNVARPAGSIGMAVSSALKKTGSVTLDAAWENAGGNERFSLSTNIDAIVEEALRELASSYAKQASAELEKELRSYVAEELEGSIASKEEFDALFAATKGDKAASDSLKKSLDTKLKDLENKAKALGTSALQGISLPKIGP
ncbi:MAG TPA: hypothetical protein DCG47_07260 [Spirochaetaceae bacterium]|jgi:uncharacterized protein (TIGR03545 family)|nr:hypothetical protein [Spirochaetaceae bacterium]